MARVRACVHELTPRRRCHEDLRAFIAEVNQELRGCGAHFRTGNAAVKFVQIDRYLWVPANRLHLYLYRADYGAR
jgi:RNA-directed DNA polymerase